MAIMKAAFLLAGACRLAGSIQLQQPGLLGNIPDHRDYGRDFVCGRLL